MAVELLDGRRGLQSLAAELFLEKRRVGRQIERSASKLNGFDEALRIEKDIHISNLTDVHNSMLREPGLSFLQFLHGGDDQTFRILDLLHHQADIHGGELRLPLAAAVNAVLTDESQSVRQHVERCRQTAAHGTHLEFVTFFGFAIMVEQSFPPIL